MFATCFCAGTVGQGAINESSNTRIPKIKVIITVQTQEIQKSYKHEIPAVLLDIKKTGKLVINNFDQLHQCAWITLCTI